MIQTVCNICKKVLKGAPPFHYCDRCLPFAAQYQEEIDKVNAEFALTFEKKIDQVRNEFMRDVVVPGSKHQALKAV